MLTLEEFKARVIDKVREITKIQDEKEFQDFLKEQDPDGYIRNGYFHITCPEIYGKDCATSTKIETQIFCAADSIVYGI